MGYPKLARGYYDKYLKSQHDLFSEPEDWETYFETKFLLEFEGEDAALKRAEPLLDFENIQSEVAPWALLLLFDAFLKRPEMLPNAANGQRKSFPMVKGNPKFLSHYGAHISFLATTMNFAKAVEMFESNASWLVDRFVLPSSRLSFLRNAWYLFDVMSEQGLNEKVVRTPKGLLPPQKESYSVQELADLLKQECVPMIARFNKRNQNQHASEYTKSIFDMKNHLIDFPV